MNLFKKSFAGIFLSLLFFLGLGLFTPFHFVKATTITVPSAYQNCGPMIVNFDMIPMSYESLEQMQMTGSVEQTSNDDCFVNQMNLGAALTEANANAGSLTYVIPPTAGSPVANYLEGGPTNLGQAQGSGTQYAYFRFNVQEMCFLNGNCGSVIGGTPTAGGEYTYVVAGSPYCVGSNCDGNGNNGNEITVNAVANPTQVNSGGTSVITYSSTNAVSCQIEKDYTIKGRYCPTSGTYYTEALASNASSNKTYNYVIKCGTGGTYNVPASGPTGDCDGVGTIFSLEKSPRLFTKNNYLEKFKDFVSNFSLQKVFADLQDPFATASVNITALYVPPAPATVTLNFKQDNYKDLLKKNDYISDLGKTHLEILVNGLLSGTCTLKNITNGDTYGTYNNSPLLKYENPTISNDVTKFKLQCTNGESSSDVTIYGQSGTLTSATPSCTIPYNQSNCSSTVPIAWTTTNPGVTTEVKNVYTGVIVASGNSGSASLTLTGAQIPNGTNGTYITLQSTNKVDAENATSSASPSATNVLGELMVNVKCQLPGDTWDGSKCIHSLNPTGSIDATNCTIPLNSAKCNSTLNWSTQNLTAADTEVTRNNPNNTHVSYATSGINITNLINHGTSTFYLIHNNGNLSQKTVTAECDSATSSWNGVKCASNATPPSGTISATNCTITKGNSTCSSTIDWSTFNPISGLTSKVTTPVNITVATGNNGTTTYNIGYGNSRKFFLYHNVELGNVAPTASCALGTTWNGLICAGKVVNPTGYLTASDCTIPADGSSCNSNLSWYTLNPISGVTSAVLTPVNTVVAIGNNGTTTYPVAYGTRNFYLYHNAVPLAQDQATATCAKNTIWNEKKCASSTGALPNLTASDPMPTTVLINSPTNFKSLIMNNGGSSTGASFVNLFQTSTSFDGSTDLTDYTTASMDSLGVNTSDAAVSPDIQFTQNIPYWVRACADKFSFKDVDGVIDEGDENDNCSNWVKVIVQSSISPDLVTSDPINRTFPVISGSPVIFDTTVTNQGSDSTGSGFVNLFQTSTSSDGSTDLTDYATDPGITSSLDPNASISDNSKSITFSTSGAYFIRACADKKSASLAGIITESDENNNCSNWVKLDVLTAGQPIDGYWTYMWGACSVECGGGTQTGTGTCVPPVNGGAACPAGGGTLIQQCNTQACITQCSNGATDYPTCKICSNGSSPESNPGGICPGGDITFTATPSVIFKGRSSTLKWSSTADSCTSADFVTGGASTNINPGVKVYPVSTKTYNITCLKNSVSQSGSATVKVISPVIIEN